MVPENHPLSMQNVSGGEPDEVQVNVILDPRTISTADNDDDDDDMAVITGAAVWKCS